MTKITKLVNYSYSCFLKYLPERVKTYFPRNTFPDSLWFIFGEWSLAFDNTLHQLPLSLSLELDKVVEPDIGLLLK